MGVEHIWALLVLIWVLGWAVIWLLRRKARDQVSLRRREMLHRERMAAIEKGVPLPELPPDDEMPEWMTVEAERIRARWLLRIALTLGLTAVTTGIGLCVGFYWAADRAFRDMWTVGLIPAMGGVGFLLYWVIATVWDRPAEP